jgi:hypothetical protein
MDLDRWLLAAAGALADWQRTLEPHDAHLSVRVTDEQLGAALTEHARVERLAR